MAAPGTFQHALGSLATVANLGLLLATLVPVPGLAGWEAVRALARLRCAEPSHAMAHAARAARACACAFAALLASLAVLAGDPLLAGLGALLAGAVWVQTGIARRLDAARRFLAERTAGQLAQTITSVVRADDRIRDLAPAARSRPALVLDRTGMFLGATGPRQLEAASRRPAARCGDAIVAAGALRIVDGDTPAAEVAGELEASGIVLVRGERRYGAIEAGDLEAQLRTWADADDAAVRSAHAGQARA